MNHSSTKAAAMHHLGSVSSPDKRAWLERLARAGYTTKGVLYVIIGVLAVQVAIGAGGKLDGSKGAIRTIAESPFGRILLALTTIGLAGYVLWRIVQAVFDVEQKGDDAKGIATRVFLGLSGLLYAGLAVMAGQLAFGGGGGGGGDTKQAWTAEVLSAPLGAWLVGLFGAAVIGFGIYQGYKAYTAKFMKSYKTSAMSHTERRFAKRAGQFGLSARGVTFAIIGFFFIQAAIQHDPSEAKGLGAALTELAQQPYGPWLLGVVAAGLVAFGVYCFSKARYRHFKHT
ncbi:DUF1206 domain-containing protein [Haliangium ochraceum]|uniref:DUF1206 domain-containing protein n=1 Tax=Haliangium ochraceum (strain DSM 14365 / JCM 11303 / SMP-2) TaxID=502025 RepID=D0LZ71_HALO1|nr:DUF1206 domain-containing protein [Haliangium ochraceum]ACY16333.1 protein of unknown function DUF1206 [Haliangium ochraceum DSM 14365]